MGVHDGHRQRLRDTYKNGGQAALSDINLLEFLLFYAIPRRDTNVIAHTLLDTFGSFEKVIKADINELIKVDGISENAAILIKLIPDIQTRMAQNDAKSKKRISSSADAGELFVAQLSGKTEEHFLVMCLDSNNRILGLTNLGKGSVNEVEVNIRTIVDNVVRTRASSVIFAHNHPDGNCNPSPEDRALTESIIRALAPLSINVLDHIIVEGDNYYSFADNSLI